MKTRKFFAAISLSVLAACAQISPQEAVQNTPARKASQNARARGDHDALSKYFEDSAKEMQAKAEEQRKLLEHYEEKSYLYGRQAQDLKSHTAAMVRKYEANADENIRQAAIHRQMAVDQKKHDRATPHRHVLDVNTERKSSN